MTKAPSASKKKEALFALYEWLEVAIASLVGLVLVFIFLFRLVSVDGRSMQNTLMDKDKLVLSGLLYTPKRGDIVVVNRYTQKPLVKRIVAVEGDILDIDRTTHQVILNGVPLYEPYLDVETSPGEDFTGPLTIDKGYVFVMGDNRGDSHDSRAADIGQVSVGDLMGKAIFRFWPFSKIGTLYNEK